MDYCKTLLTQWSYRSFALSLRYHPLYFWASGPIDIRRRGASGKTVLNVYLPDTRGLTAKELIKIPMNIQIDKCSELHHIRKNVTALQEIPYRQKSQRQSQRQDIPYLWPAVYAPGFWYWYNFSGAKWRDTNYVNILWLR